MAKLLLVEDDISLRDIYNARFEAEGYNVAVASNGEEALAAAVKEKPDLILLDIMMPRISGFDVLDIIRTTPETAHTKVIIMTALSDPESRAKAEKLGVNKFLVKSQVTLEDIVSQVKQELMASTGETNEAPKEPLMGVPKDQAVVPPHVQGQGSLVDTAPVAPSSGSPVSDQPTNQ